MTWEHHVPTGEDTLPQAALDQRGGEGWELGAVTAHSEERSVGGIEPASVTVVRCFFTRPVADDEP